MFDIVHRYKKAVTIVLSLIALTFVTWGLESYTRMQGARDAAAKVNGLEVPVREFEEALSRQQDQVRQILGRDFDPSMLDTAETRRAVLDSLVNQRLVAAEAVEARLTVSDERLFEAITSMQVFHGEDGKFSRERYEAVLRSQNPPMAPVQFESQMRYELALAQLTRAVGEAAIPSRTASARLAALEGQKREIAEARISADSFLKQVQVEPSEVAAYYEANKEAFRTPERIRAQYVVLSAEEMAAREQVTPEEVRAEWESQYAPKLREKEEARKKAQVLAAEVRKRPESFAEVAKKQSQDPGTREQGGDLGYTTRGSFVKPFEDVLFRMKPGQISDVVETEFGFHIIHLTDVRRQDGKEERRASHILITAPVDAKPLEAARDEIEAELKKARASKRFPQAVDTFTNMVYEQPDSLEPVAKELGLQIRTTDWITRAGDKLPRELQNPKLLDALFSQDALQNKRNTDATEVAPATFVSGRVLEHQPAAQRSLDEVRDQIAEQLRRRKAAEFAQKEGTAKLAQLREGGDAGVKWSATKTVSRGEPQGLPAQALRAVMSADTAKLPAYVGVDLPDAGYLLVRVAKVIPGEAAAEQATARGAALAGRAQYDAWLASLREQADIEINPKVLERPR